MRAEISSILPIFCALTRRFPDRQRLAVALIENDTLTSLDLSYNSVTPAAAMVLAFALKVGGCSVIIALQHPAGYRVGIVCYPAVAQKTAHITCHLCRMPYFRGKRCDRGTQQGAAAGERPEQYIMPP